MSRWDVFPYVSTGKELGKGPLWVQVLVGFALAAFWTLFGFLTHEMWRVGVGGVFAFLTLFIIVRRVGRR